MAYPWRLWRTAGVLAVAALVPVLWLPSWAFAQQPPPPAAPVAQPPDFARVRARFESLTPVQVRALGYTMEPACVAAPPGGMGFHAMNQRIFDAQFRTGRLDPQNPPILLIDGNGRVVGLEWEQADLGRGAPVLFGQTIQLQPGHPGLEESHHMLHAYFKPGGRVLFDVFDPALQCPPPGVVPPVLNVLLPTALPRTGGVPIPGPTAPLSSFVWLASGLSLAAALGLAALQRTRRR